MCKEQNVRNEYLNYVVNATKVLLGATVQPFTTWFKTYSIQTSRSTYQEKEMNLEILSKLKKGKLMISHSDHGSLFIAALILLSSDISL